MHQKPLLSVVAPIFNEEGILPLFLQAVRTALGEATGSLQYGMSRARLAHQLGLRPVRKLPPRKLLCTTCRNKLAIVAGQRAVVRETKKPPGQ